MSVPGSKMSFTDERPGTVFDSILSSHATPTSRFCSNGTVMSCSTSSAESPSASVWTSTVGRENSGSVSTLASSPSCQIPTAITTTAATTTARENFRLDPTIQRIIAGDLRPVARRSLLALHSEAGLAREHDRLCPIGDLELVEDVRDVVADRLRADPQLGRDHRVGVELARSAARPDAPAR